MKRTFNSSFASSTQANSNPLVCVACVALVVFLFSCSPIPSTLPLASRGEASGLPLRYSIVFIIHGDGDYLYHDPGGNAHRADEETLTKARTVAELNPQAEVFIFHERPRKHRWLFFSVRDGAFYYYRNGQRLAQETYWRNQGHSRFDPEVELYQRFRAAEQPPAQKFFLYFGHEIPEFGGAGYDASYKKRAFTVNDLAEGLKYLTPDSTKFDLLVLSTCYNGTPHTLATLAPYARYVVASPENLHLSYFDLKPFERLNISQRDGDLSTFATQFAHQAFDRLTQDVQTAVTVAVYDMDRVQPYLRSVEKVDESRLTNLRGEPPGTLEHSDCAEDSAYTQPGMSEGVEIFYRPPLFGRAKHKLTHSGWECWKRMPPTSN
jgi:hypothetical protein